MRGLRVQSRSSSGKSAQTNHGDRSDCGYPSPDIIGAIVLRSPSGRLLSCEKGKTNEFYQNEYCATL